MNDNMRGIFLHILADTLGSVGVVILTILTRFFSWQGFDPVASIIIALLIFFSALPLMKSTASTLLLKLDTTKEATIRSALNDIASIKGVKSFSTPRFWSSENTLQGYLHVQIYRGHDPDGKRLRSLLVQKTGWCLSGISPVPVDVSAILVRARLIQKIHLK